MVGALCGQVFAACLPAALAPDLHFDSALPGALCSQPWDTWIIYITGFLLHIGKACSPRNGASFSCAPASPQCPMQSSPSSLNHLLTKTYRFPLGESRLLVEPTWVKPMSSKPVSFCRSSHSYLGRVYRELSILGRGGLNLMRQVKWKLLPLLGNFQDISGISDILV